MRVVRWGTRVDKSKSVQTFRDPPRQIYITSLGLLRRLLEDEIRRSDGVVDDNLAGLDEHGLRDGKVRGVIRFRELRLEQPLARSVPRLLDGLPEIGAKGAPVLDPGKLAGLVGGLVDLEEDELWLGDDGVEDGLEGFEEGGLVGWVDVDRYVEAEEGGHDGGGGYDGGLEIVFGE